MKRLLTFWILICVTKLIIAQPDTIWNAGTQNEPIIKWKHKYHQTLVMKLFLSQSLYDGKYKKKDNGKSKVYCNIEEALEIVKKVDLLTLGIPKIIYLVGWQYNGHDSKYPAWFEGNDKLKRPQDVNTFESIKWLMEESAKYNTTISLHINMFDAYLDSPLWNEYLEKNIIAKDKNGLLREGEWGYPISYAQEWHTGLAQKRIDSLCNLLPIQKSGTIHIDAFHSWPPIGEKGPGQRPFIKGPISPYLNFTIDDEIEAQKNIIKYWATKGIDVTSEGATFLRESSFEGLQPMAWWVDWNFKEYLSWPSYYYSGGMDRSEYGKLFGTSIHGEEIFKKDPKNLNGFLSDFCLKTLVWYYLNRHERLYLVLNKDYKQVKYSENVETKIENGNFTLDICGYTYVKNDDILLPALWCKEPTLVAYSKNGYVNKTWRLPQEYRIYSEFKVYDVSNNGVNFTHSMENSNGQISLTIKPDQTLKIIPLN